MRWIAAACAFVVLVVLLEPAFDTARDDASYAHHLHSPIASDKGSSIQSEKGGDVAGQPIKASAEPAIDTSSLREPTVDRMSSRASKRISIGEPMDPNDESTLPVSTERISIGERVDVD